MPEGLVDTATISQVVQFLDRGMSGQYPWSFRTVLDFTALLIREGHLALAPGLAPPKGVILDDQDLLVDSMLSNGLVSLGRQLDDSIKTSAITRSKQWIGRAGNIVAVRQEVDRLLSDQKDFGNWIDWAATNAWVAHSRRLGGLADDTYLEYVAKILNMPFVDLQELQSRSKNAQELHILTRKRDSNFEILTRAYVASAIIRGRYHEEVARHFNIQITRHPIRGIISKARTGQVGNSIHVPLAASCLASIVLYGAVKQKNLRDRLHCWVRNVRNVRSLFDRGGLALADGPGHAAVNSAFIIAREAKVEIVDAGLDSFFEIATGLGIGALTWIFLSPWVGIPVGVTVRYGLKKAGYPGRIRNVIAYQTKQALLKELAGGRIETDWS